MTNAAEQPHTDASRTSPRLAASIAVFRDGRVLLARRAAPPLAGCWSLPGGAVEGGETLADAALRELHEEVAVRAEIIDFNRHVELIARDANGSVSRHWVVASFVGRWSAGEGVPGLEASEVAWVRPDQVAAMTTTPELHAVVERAARIAAKNAA